MLFQDGGPRLGTRSETRASSQALVRYRQMLAQRGDNRDEAQLS